VSGGIEWGGESPVWARGHLGKWGGGLSGNGVAVRRGVGGRTVKGLNSNSMCQRWVK